MYDNKKQASAINCCIEADQCIGCAICADVCRTDALAMSPDDLAPSWNLDKCNACSICVRQCPTEAITVTRVAKAGKMD